MTVLRLEVGRFLKRSLLGLSFSVFVACGGDIVSAPPQVPEPVYLTAVWGDQQSAEVSHRLADSLVVRLVTIRGVPVPGKHVSWKVTTTPGGELSQTTTTTDANGE